VAAITISRELGSLGRQVAQLAAEKLGYRLVWRDLINQAAIRAGAPEMALAAIDELGLLGLTPSLKERRAYSQAMQRVIEELVSGGNVVILGRAGQALLRDRAAVLHVRIIAPVPVRAERISREKGVSLDAALAQIQASDRSRYKYLRRFYRLRWDDPKLYDLVINTANLTPEAAALLVAQALALKLQSLTPVLP
jgi:cytidylate kinase